MNHLRIFAPFRYLALVMSAALLVGFAQAQEFPVGLESISPVEGQPGQELEVTLRGWGFGDANEVRVIIGELEIWESWVISHEEMGAVLYIPEEARPGPRDVEVFVVFGPDEEFPAFLESGFTVLERAPPPEDFNEQPEEPEQGFSGWDALILVLLGGLVLVGGSVVLALTLVWRRTVMHQKWQAQATESELPETCQTGTHFIRREKPEIKPGRWKVTGVKVTVYDADSRATDAAHQASSELVKNLDKAVRQRLLLGMSESLEGQLQQAAEILSGSILAWQSGSESGQDLYLQTRLEGGQAEQNFTRYRCVGAPGGWQKQGEWTLKLKAVDHLPRTVRGPSEGESPGAYAGFLREQVGAYLLGLLKEAGSLF